MLGDINISADHLYNYINLLKQAHLSVINSSKDKVLEASDCMTECNH